VAMHLFIFILSLPQKEKKLVWTKIGKDQTSGLVFWILRLKDRKKMFNEPVKIG
jgi:hypothetical protein